MPDFPFPDKPPEKRDASPFCGLRRHLAPTDAIWGRFPMAGRLYLSQEARGAGFRHALQPYVVILALLAGHSWLAASAQTIDAPLSNAQRNAFSPAAIRTAPSNSIARSPQMTTTTLGKPTSANTASAAAANTSAGGSTNRMDAFDDRYKLTIGDRLSFRIVEDEDDPRQIIVNDSGDLEVPYIGRYPAVGITCKDLASKLKAELEKEYYYHATVIIEVTESARRGGRRATN